MSSTARCGLFNNDWLAVQAGGQHESNGRGGEASRSTNYLYIKPFYGVYSEARRMGFMVSPKIWAYLGNSGEHNPDLADYRGYFDLELAFGWAESLVLRSHLGWAKEGGSVQLDLTYPLHKLLKNLNFYLYVQYVNALAESLLNYRERTEALRFGIAIQR